MTERRPSAGIIAYIVLIFAVAMVLGLTLGGCTSVPPGTYVGSGTCDQCIGPYDVTLTSHRAALARGL
ncbi:MAG: hypothetical protein DI533_20090 [Cereibacter sphaeroides]|uniref:Lipoprotein n=1 Tax=Cereibacter sphaeroides TaxID=1063 RepID=A0A2W5TWK0_CERSP|nr:MAG: hypothetical protein DI533_20090 [Cereibacter sphaeroides]